METFFRARLFFVFVFSVVFASRRPVFPPATVIYMSNFQHPRFLTLFPTSIFIARSSLSVFFPAIALF